MVTAGTYGKERHISTPERLDFVTDKLMEHAEQYGWHLQAWAVMANHYHFIGFSVKPESLSDLISVLHTETARHVNKLDGTVNRKVWYQYWDSHITYQRSYYARLKYVHNNPVHHGIVLLAEDYRWCSAGWFKMNADTAFRKTIESFRNDFLKVKDDY